MNYFLVGIKGTGMSALAMLLKDLGNNVVGSDENKEYFHSINWKLAEQIYDDIVNGEEGMDDGE